MIHLNTLTLLSLTAIGAAAPLSAQSFRIDFQDGASAWQTVLDGVMGGRSSGRVAMAEPGVLAFTGRLSLENNGGFSQMRAAVDGGAAAGAEGFEIECRGDGRTYKFDIRLSNVRMMAGAYQQDFETRAGEWTTIRLPLDGFRLYSFGRAVRNAPALDASKIESIGVTLADKTPGDFRLELRSIATYGAQVAGASTDGDSGTDLVSVAKAARLDTLLQLVTAAGLELPKEPVTIFAPTDAAFAELPDGALASLLEARNRGQLTEVLGLHVVPGRIAARELLVKKRLTGLLGKSIEVSLEDGRVVPNGTARVITADIQASNGVVHVIDQVLLPPVESDPVAGASRPIEPPSDDLQTEALRAQLESLYTLAIDRGARLFNQGNAEACAAVYEVLTESILGLAGDRLTVGVRTRLERARSDAADAVDWTERAWVLRRALDAAHAELRPTPRGQLRPRGASAQG